MKKILCIIFIACIAFNIEAKNIDAKANGPIRYKIEVEDKKAVREIVDFEYYDYTPSITINLEMLKTKWDDISFDTVEEASIKGRLWKTKDQNSSLYDVDMQDDVKKAIPDDVVAKKYSEKRDVMVKEYSPLIVSKLCFEYGKNKYCIVRGVCKYENNLYPDIDIFHYVNGKWLKTGILSKYSFFFWDLYNNMQYLPEKKDGREIFLKWLESKKIENVIKEKKKAEDDKSKSKDGRNLNKTTPAVQETTKESGKTLKRKWKDAPEELPVTESVKTLVERLDDKDSNVRMDALNKLIRVGGREAIDLGIVKALDDSDDVVRTGALSYFTKVFDMKSIDALVKRFKKECELKDKLDKKAKDYERRRKIQERLRNTYSDVLADCGKSIVKILLPEFDKSSNEDYKGYIATIVGRLGYKDEKIFQCLLNSLKERDDPLLRETIAETLGILRDKNAIPALKEALKDNHSRKILYFPENVLKIEYTVRNKSADSLKKLGVELEQKGDDWVVK
ncbi:MAG: HEAT repeat domain-containing protein [Candidatus Firestonebacteria bacterium]